MPPGTPPIAPARRDISRVTRLHWLTGRRSATENWDAFEAPSGGPLLKRNEASLDWPAARVVLADLLHEFAAALKEGSLPPLGLDRLWMRADGRTVLLDFEAPGEGWWRRPLPQKPLRWNYSLPSPAASRCRGQFRRTWHQGCRFPHPSTSALVARSTSLAGRSAGSIERGCCIARTLVPLAPRRSDCDGGSAVSIHRIIYARRVSECGCSHPDPGGSRGDWPAHGAGNRRAPRQSPG